jgi:hypothetical protein
MSVFPVTSSQCEVLVDFAPLAPTVAQYLVSAEVDSTMFVPSQFKLVFQAVPDVILLTGGLQLTVPVVVQASVDGVPVPVITGEVTAVEVEFDQNGTYTVVRGMDRSHRLMRGNQTMAYPEALASEVVTALLGEAAVPPGEIVPTSTVYEWLSQANVSDWEFIQQLARAENYVAYADAEGLFNFCPMPLPEEGDPPAVNYSLPAQPTQLVVGKNVRRLRGVVSSAEQVPTVTVGGYDMTTATPVVGVSPLEPSTAVLLDPATEPVAVSGEFGAKPFNDASRPFFDEGAADTWARSVAADLAGSLAEVEAECDGDPALVAGAVISLGMAGQPFEGNYVCTAARHVFAPNEGGYTTWVTVGGYRDRSTFALASGSSPTDSLRPSVPGLVVGTVVATEDPLQLGRVKVRFPWLDPDYVSGWARMVQIGASKLGTGFLWMPEIGDEVLVGFDRGSIDAPYVIGNLHNGLAPPDPPPEYLPEVAFRRITSGLGHTIQWNDDPAGESGISISTAPAEGSPASIVLNGEEVSITISSDGQISISGKVQVSISSEAALSLTAPQISIGSEDTVSLSIAGTTVSIGGAGTESVSVGSPSTATVSVSGAMVSLGGG